MAKETEERLDIAAARLVLELPQDCEDRYKWCIEAHEAGNQALDGLKAAHRKIIWLEAREGGWNESCQTRNKRIAELETELEVERKTNADYLIAIRERNKAIRKVHDAIDVLSFGVQ